MPRLLVTGAPGFLGRAVVAAGPAAGWEMVGTALTHPDWVALDVRDAAAVVGVVDAVAPDAIIHTAYRQHGEEAMAVNAAGAGHIAAAARTAGARLVHVSSDAIFAGDGDRALREGDIVRPVTAYGATKAAAEVAVEAANPAALMVRTSLLIGGPGHAPSPHEALALAAARGEEQVTFFTDEIRSAIQVDDLAAALLELAAQDGGGPLHVGGADGLSRLELAQLVVGAAGLDVGMLRGAAAPADRPRHCPLDSGLAQTRLRTRLRGAREIYAG
ncbi:sugar nucleotide-binding protein [Baekduia sp.]|uniref:sugar nucleotide-binding protein n=1 Tax=Baekduia sp. TaxID=2600305 RepID=UPI002E0C603A|nr:sugar nucleotide-binding protein [Baekduia sp.]